jgi:CRP-like cAMP-binding protein
MNLFKFSREIKVVGAGETIFQEGDNGAEMYVVQEGLVEIVIAGQVIEVVSEGELFGEMVLISGTVRTASAIAQTNCRLAIIKAEQFRFLVQHNHYFVEWLMNILTKRLTKMNQTVLVGDLDTFSQYQER